MAHPLDRLAANVIDVFIVLGPFLIVLVAPFKRMLRQAILLDDSSHLFLSLGLCVVTLVLFSFLYKIYITWRYGGTFGQLFMSLRVVNIWEPNKKNLGDHILRSIYWVFSYMLLGLPFLSIFSNEKRRCFHDRVSDTLVLSLKRRSYPRPSFIEKNLARFILSCVFLLVFLYSFPQLYSFYESLNKQDDWSHILEEEGWLCTSIGEALEEEWPEEEGPARLSVAMALYAASEVEESCLKSEVEFVYRSGVDSGLADLASAFLYADDIELSNQYLTAVCEDHPESESCQMSRVIELWSEDEDKEISSAFEEFGRSSSVYVIVWGIRHFYRNQQYDKAMEMLKSISHVRRLTDFLSSQTVKLHWVNMRTQEARTSAETAMMAMSEKGRLNLSNWLCFEERATSCDSHPSCDYMRTYWSRHPESLNSDPLALTFLKDSVCKDKNYKSVRKKVPKGLVNDLVVALGSQDKRKSLERYLEKSHLTPRLKAEALRELISVDSIKGLKTRTSNWLASKRSWEWEKTGRVLFQRLSQVRVWDQAYKVGLVLLNRQPGDTQLQERLVVAAYKSNRLSQAQRILSDYYKRKRGSRSPNSQSENSFSWVSRQLGALGEGG